VHKEGKNDKIIVMQERNRYEDITGRRRKTGLHRVASAWVRKHWKFIWSKK